MTKSVGFDCVDLARRGRVAVGIVLFSFCFLGASTLILAGEFASTVPVKNSLVGIEWWEDKARHIGDAIHKAAGEAKLVFVGDSITARWPSDGPDSMNALSAPFKSLNIGIGGDSTQHVLWRLQHGQLDGYQARLFVVMIGTNNDGPPEEVAAGVKAILDEIQGKQPQANILLLGIFPRGEQPITEASKNCQTNRLIARFEGGAIHYLDLTRNFLLPDGTVDARLMPDLLHLSEAGYRVWADATRDTVKRLMDEPNMAAMLGPGPYKKLAPLAAKIKAGGGFGQALKALDKKKQSKDAAEAAEATMMFDAITAAGGQSLESALALKSMRPDLALARLQQVAALFAGDAIGTQAKSEAAAIRKDPQLAKAIAAEEAYMQLCAFERSLRFAGPDRNPSSAAFRQANARAIAGLVERGRGLAGRYPGTPAAKKVEEMLQPYLEPLK